MNRMTDRDLIEHRLLELAYTTDARLTPSALAFYAPCSIEDATSVLDDLAARDQVTMEIDDDGHVVYQLRDRQKLPPPAATVETPPPPPPLRAIVPVRRSPLALRDPGRTSPALAALLSLALPGAGQVYSGHLLGGIFWFLLVSAGYALLVPGLFLHLLCVVSAAGSAHRLNTDVARMQLLRG